MNSLVSILIPAHNAERWIGDTIRSAVQQTWPNKEIIIVDDGSTDSTSSVAGQFASKTLSVVTQKNQGAAAARNHASEISQGDYFQWLDADDLLAPDKIALQMEVAQRCGPRALISGSWGYFMYRPAKAKFVPSPLWADLTPVEWMLRKWENNAHMQTATWLVSRDLTTKAGPWDTRLLGDDDGEYFLRVIRSSDGIRFVPEAKVFYRASGASRLSHIGRSKEKIEAQFLGMKMQIGYLLSMEKNERTRAACLNYLQTWLGNFYPERPDIVEEAQRIAGELGGKLQMPRLRRKYAWMQPILGYDMAKRVQILLPEIRWSMESAWDKALFALENWPERRVVD